MQSAFVDIGLERDAFLYVSDFFEDNEEYDAVVSTVEEKVLKMERGGTANGAPEPVVAAAAPAEEVPVAAAASAAEAATDAAGGTVTALVDDRPAEQRQERPEGARDRGGRGRRGRRRRGGRPGGLPDSKFFSPREFAACGRSGTGN